MENKKGKTLKLISYISLCVFSFVSLFSGVLAWFTARRVQDPDSDSMRVVNPTGIFNKMTIHKLHTYDKTEDGVYSYYFDQTASGTIANDGNNKVTYEGDTRLEFGEYNMLDQRHPLLLLVQLNDSEDTGVYIKAKTDAIFLGDIDNNHQILDEERNIIKESDGTLTNNGNFPLSSIIRFFSQGLTETKLGELEVANKSNAATQSNNPTIVDTYYFKEASAYTYSSMTTLSYDDNTHAYKGTTAKDTSMYSNATYTKYVAIIVDYYDDLIEAIYNAYLGFDEVSDPDNDLMFKCDFTMVI